jgi:hypothetical protein
MPRKIFNALQFFFFKEPPGICDGTCSRDGAEKEIGLVGLAELIPLLVKCKPFLDVGFIYMPSSECAQGVSEKPASFLAQTEDYDMGHLTPVTSDDECAQGASEKPASFQTEDQTGLRHGLPNAGDFGW